MFQIIEDYETAKVLSEAGLLWWSNPTHSQDWRPDRAGYWLQDWTTRRQWTVEVNNGLLYAVLLEE